MQSGQKILMTGTFPTMNSPATVSKSIKTRKREEKLLIMLFSRIF